MGRKNEPTAVNALRALDVAEGERLDTPRLRAVLRRLAASGEKGAPLAFVGRKREIAKVMDSALPMLDGDIPCGRTLLIQGAPGAGKTALIREAARRLEERGLKAITQPDVPSAAKVRTLYETLATALAGAGPDLFRTTARTDAGIKAAPAGLGSRGKTVTAPVIDDPDHVAALRRGEDWGPHKGAVLFIDEVQNIHSDPEAPASRLARALHTQSSMPALLICSGLSDSEDALERAGLTRIGTTQKIALGPLAREESVECARRTLKTVRDLGVGGGDGRVDSWAIRIADASDGWPRHLQNYFIATWEVLAEQEKPNADRMDIGAVMERGDGLRRAYYVERVARTGLPNGVLAALHGRLRREARLDRLQAAEVVGEAVDRLPPRHRQMIRTEMPNDVACLARLLHSGVVALDAERRCISPIPSLSDHILAEAERT